eukprot:sb/3464686/
MQTTCNFSEDSSEPLPGFAIGEVPEITEKKRAHHNKGGSKHHERKREKSRKKESSTAGNEIDLNHADYEDSALVADLNKRQLKEQLVKSAIKHIEESTCLRFKERSTEVDFLNITSMKGCTSFVGRRGGPQEVSVGSGCVTRGIIAHELAHAIGFYHEQSRPDRDLYVELLKENVKSDELGNFRKRDPSEVDSLNSPYDYGSLMHYGLKDFSGNKQPTLRGKLWRHSHLVRSHQVSMVPNDNISGNQVLVTECGLSKSSQKWSWTSNYQLRNEGLTLCLSVEDGAKLGDPGDVPIRMVACDADEDRQKWICNGGTLKNIALEKCVNAGWTALKKSYMIAVSECDVSDIKQVLSVYTMGRRYEPVCHRWTVAGPKPECYDETTKSISYLGCRKQNKNYAMIGYEKRGKRNNLKAIRDINCCQLVNTTDALQTPYRRATNVTDVTYF